MTRSLRLGVLLIFSSTVLTLCTSYNIEPTSTDESTEYLTFPGELNSFRHEQHVFETTTPATETTTTRTTTTTAAAAETTTENILRDEDVKAMALLNETIARIQATQFHLYKQKTELSLKSVNGVISELKTIEESLSDLLASSAPGSAHPEGASFTEFKNRNDALENELSLVNERMGSDRRDIDRYSAAYRGVEDALSVAQQTLEGILLPSLNPVYNNVNVDINGPEGVHGTTEVPTTTPSFIPTPIGGNNSQSCGGSFKSKRGYIMYKLNENLNPNEGCIWIISPLQNIHGASLRIRESQFTQTSLTYVAVGPLVTRYGIHDEFNLQKLNSSNTEPEFIPISARVVFIQFVSSATSGTNKGFHLDFELIYSGPDSNTNLTVKEPEDTFLTGPSGTFKYPQNAPLYSANARAVIVIQPTLPNTSLYIKWYGIDARGPGTGIVYGFLNIWRFGSNPLNWQRQEQLNGWRNLDSVSHYARKYSNVGIRNKNPFVLDFKSDGFNNGPGFELFWNNSGD